MVYLLPIAYLETLVILPISVVMLGMLGNNLINHLTERNISRKPKFLSHMCRPNHTSFCAGKLGQTNNSVPIPAWLTSWRTVFRMLPSLIEPSNGWRLKAAKFLALMITDTALCCLDLKMKEYAHFQSSFDKKYCQQTKNSKTINFLIHWYSQQI